MEVFTGSGKKNFLNEQNSFVVDAVKVGESGYAYMLNDSGMVIAHPKKEFILKRNLADEFDFAKEIMKMSKLDCKIYPIETDQYPTPASRPHYSILNKTKIKKKFEIKILSKRFVIFS